MLDNLKLGYGGTAGEMARLINDSGVLGESVKITAQEVKNVPFDKVIEAIHVIQTDIGITGTTTKEAADTIQGSAGSMQAAWQNLLTGLADDQADFNALVDNLVSSVVTMAGNMLPRIQKIIMGMGSMVGQLLTTLVPEIVNTIPPLLEQTLPILVDAIDSMITAFMDVLPVILPIIAKLIPQVIVNIVNTLTSQLPVILQSGAEILMAIIEGIIASIPDLIRAVPQIIKAIVVTIWENLPRIVEMGWELIQQLGRGINEATGGFLAKIADFITRVFQKIAELPSKVYDVGANLVRGIWNGINSAVDWVLDKIRGFGNAILSGIKRIFGIASPSRLMENEVGTYLAQGIGVGFEDEMANVTKQMQESIPTSFDTSTTVNSGSGSNPYFDMVMAFKEALAEMKIELDDEVAGRFVEKTVTRAIYA